MSEITEGADSRSCPRCGTTAEEVQATGFVGCEECYDRFGRLIARLIEELERVG